MVKTIVLPRSQFFTSGMGGYFWIFEQRSTLALIGLQQANFDPDWQA